MGLNGGYRRFRSALMTDCATRLIVGANGQAAARGVHAHVLSSHEISVPRNVAVLRWFAGAATCSRHQMRVVGVTEKCWWMLHVDGSRADTVLLLNSGLSRCWFRCHYGPTSVENSRQQHEWKSRAICACCHPRRSIPFLSLLP